MTESTVDSDTPPSFDDLDLADDVRLSIADMGFSIPTPVQAATFAPAIEGSDLIVQARTGTGKTVAFGLPLVERLIKADGGPQALILAPTRELALQSSREIGRLGARRDIRTAAVYGGAPIERQVRELKEGAQIVSGTPGRVLDHLKRGTLPGDRLRILILDEADEMLSMGFARELNAIVSLLPTKRQTMLFSATIDSAVERMSKRILNEPIRISLSSDAVGAQTITHYYYLISGMGKVADLVRILENEDPESALIFCNTKVATERCAQTLKASGFDADWLNGDLPQSEREKVLRRTRNGELRYLVATDVAARGIDISHVTHVINFDFPEHIEAYIHRTGRTGRAGKTGTAISLVSPPDLGSLYYLRLTYKIFPIERSLPSAGELQTRREADRILLLSQAFQGPSNDIDRAVARRLLTHPDAERLLGGLLQTFFGTSADADEESAAARRERRPPARSASQPRPSSTHPPAETAKAEPPNNERADKPESSPRQRQPRRRDTIEDMPAVSAGTDAEERPDKRPDDHDDENHAYLYVNLGRRDGVRPGEIIRLLGDECGIDRGDVGRIRIRDRHTFVGVPKEQVEAIVEELSGKESHDKELVVELARAQP